ncbi:unnamed protein product [Cercopithifilaria johnstoni]|uniref:Uncharacterized protein n=1 Tax=Cercopithifilaria johnstoni TaxID=2874296 RepID=A0A8J2LZ87_9BILA|nr:unnamed protein product [Cercopithifilaria johnstoni]
MGHKDVGHKTLIDEEMKNVSSSDGDTQTTYSISCLSSGVADAIRDIEKAGKQKKLKEEEKEEELKLDLTDPSTKLTCNTNINNVTE